MRFRVQIFLVNGSSLEFECTGVTIREGTYVFNTSEYNTKVFSMRNVLYYDMDRIIKSGWGN